MTERNIEKIYRSINTNINASVNIRWTLLTGIPSQIERIQHQYASPKFPFHANHSGPI